MNGNSQDTSKPPFDEVAPHASAETIVPVHACPLPGSGVMPCCGALPFERQSDRITTDLALVTCGGKAVRVRPYITLAERERSMPKMRKLKVVDMDPLDTMRELCRDMSGDRDRILSEALETLAQLVGVAPGIIETARASVMSEFGSAFCADYGGDRVRQLISVDVVSLAMATHNNNAAPSQERARFAPRQARRIRSANDRIRKTEIES